MSSEIEELRARVIASMASSGNPKSRDKRNLENVREEGELSSSSSEEKENNQNSTELASASPSVSVEPVAVAVPKANSASVSTRNVVGPRRPASSRGKYVPGDLHKRTSISRAPPQSYQWRSESSQIPSRSTFHRNHGRRMTSNDNDNLVIRFSDNDSGSDSEEIQNSDKTKPFQSDQIKQRAVHQVKSSTSHQRRVPNMAASALTRAHAANSKGLRSSVEGASQSQGHGVSNMVSASPECISDDKKSNNNELETLRQRIATRESELKQRSFGSKTMEKVSTDEDPCVVKADMHEQMNSGSLVVEGRRSILKTQENRQAGYKQSESSIQSDGPKRMLMSATTPILRYERQEQDSNPLRGTGLVASSECGNGNIDYRNKRSASSDTANGGRQGGKDKQERHDICSSFYSEPVAHATKKPKLHFQTNNAFCSSMIKSTAEVGMASAVNNSTLINLTKGIPGGKNPQDTPQDILTQSAAHVDNKLATCDVQHGDSGQVCMDFQTLMEIEEWQDKELEEAQELRRRCEMEERYALRAYRKAQRALMDANERCAYLYQRRELLSAQLQASLMEGHSLLSSGWHKQKSVNVKLPGGGLNIFPYLCAQTQADYEALAVTKSNNQSVANHDLLANQKKIGHDAGFSPSSCPDGDPPGRLHAATCAVKGTNTQSNHDAVHTQSDNICTSLDEDEQMFPADGQGASYILNCDEGNKLEVGPANEDGKEPQQIYNLDDSLSNPIQDALLEASLRSKLFSRLQIGPASTNSISDFENFDGGNNGTARNSFIQASFSNQSLPETAQNGSADIDHHPQGLLGNTVEHQSQLEIHSDDGAGLHDVDPSPIRYNDSEECCSSLGESGRSPFTMGSYVASAALNVVCRVKVLPLSKISYASSSGVIQTESTAKGMHDKGLKSRCSENLLDIFSIDMTNKGIGGGKVVKLDTEDCNLEIDPFWPFCMFELRGKCNNGQCPYQHVRHYARKNQVLSGASDEKVNHISSQRDSLASQGTFPDFHTNVMPIPIYLIGGEIIKTDKSSLRHVLAQKIWHYWQSSFCSSFSIPFPVHRILPPDVLSLHYRGDVDDDGSRNWLSLYMNQSQDYMMERVLNADAYRLDGELPSFEMQEKRNRSRKGSLLTSSISKFLMAWLILKDPWRSPLIYLAGKAIYWRERKRSLEANPRSVALWVVYLHIFYKSEKSIGNDDMFLHAVRQNEYSYELWLMFINSRISLSERLEAYDSALLKLCHLVHTDKRERKYMSGCILDLFLQSVNTLCISGYKESAMSRIDELYRPKPEKCRHVPIFEIMPCLVMSDRCILWVSCIYLVVYGRLPDAVVGCFEFDKELPFGIEWPSVQLIENDKNNALQLINLAIDKTQMSPESELHNEEESQIKSRQALAVNHIKCMAALKGVECVSKLIDDYRKLYPSCIELLMLSVDTRKHHCEGNVDLSLLEDSVNNWPKGFPGIEIVWNQYFGYALAKNGQAFVKDLMAANWFQTAWRLQNSDTSFNQEATQNDENVLFDPCVPASMTCSYSNLKDKAYALLNLALYKLLYGDKDGAQSAMDKAVMVASAEDFNHLVVEHAAFSLSNASDLIREFPDGKLFSLLYGYIVAARSYPSPEPLSRRFLSCIKKSRLRQLITNMMGPVSLDSSVVNSILKCWYSPSLLPDEYGDFKALTDFVETLMDVLPANYKLALSICKWIAHLHDPCSISSTAALFWASSVLVNSILQAFPVAPERIWTEAAEVLGCLDVDVILERFHQLAISVYPFSISLWRSYFNLHRRLGDPISVVEAAKQRGIELE
ncbi:uncharacterized protein LOC116254780 isoform X2 [Nymphaea colorata]|uniref:uncharacterized protein LOC116254780 isoform X2 n=1 Tax=Nymphaea colorata TaxID=210225 RepID=UPI00214E83C5|nr:uncharacterized protein LOC116254780 isoform X2 [Nymphaea colorata]